MNVIITIKFIVDLKVCRQTTDGKDSVNLPTLVLISELKLLSS